MTLHASRSTAQKLRSAGTCPVCNGFGSTPFAFGRGTPLTMPCGACDGTGSPR